MDKNVLVLSAHPDIAEKSKACAALLSAVKDLPKVRVMDLSEIPATVENYYERVKAASVIVLQFPFWWGSAPAILKTWIDTLMLGFLEDPSMKGKRLLVATSVGSGPEVYRAGGAEQFTVDEILRPFQVMAIYSGMTYLTPFVLYGTMLPDAEQRIQRGAKEYRALIEQL
ncbi:MAG: NAD(P)H-dependent oxidoreductase [Opitutales bacterium]|nr:NAD(P)H-dependent oxidoreductase [Opitutales bacterium]